MSTKPNHTGYWAVGITKTQSCVIWTAVVSLVLILMAVLYLITHGDISAAEALQLLFTVKP